MMISSRCLRILFLISIAGLSCFSCGQPLYKTWGQNVPLFKERGQFALGGGISGSEGDLGINVDAATSLTNNLALIGKYSLYSNLDWITGTSPSNGHYLELGGGYYRRYQQEIVVEAFAGAGFATARNLGATSTYFHARYNKMFIQPTIAWSIKHFDVAFTPKLAYVTYTQHEEDVIDSFSVDVPLFFETMHPFVFEPGITMRVGGESFKVQFQYVYTSFHSSTTFNSLTLKHYASIGLVKHF